MEDLRKLLVIHARPLRFKLYVLAIRITFQLLSIRTLYVFAIRIKKATGMPFTLYDFRNSYNLASDFERFFIRFRIPYKNGSPVGLPFSVLY